MVPTALLGLNQPPQAPPRDQQVANDASWLAWEPGDAQPCPDRLLLFPRAQQAMRPAVAVTLTTCCNSKPQADDVYMALGNQLLTAKP